MYMRYACMMDSGILWKPKVVVETSPTCPRCGSTNTKFCYYNNYSLTQPRYFCKSCRRYWTKGGSLRNVPVGGGCRKSTRSRSSSSGGNYKHINNNSIRASSSIHRDDVVLGHVNIINSSTNYFSSNTITTTTGSLAPPVTDAADDNGRPNIDLALVYANFLNPGSPPPPLPVSQPPPPSSVFLECVSFSDRLSLENEHVTTRDGNIDPFNYFGSGMNSFDDEKKQQQETTTVRDHLQQNNNYLLLAEPNYLAGEETMVWPSSDLICPRYPVIDAVHESTMEILPRVQDSNQVDDDHEEDGSPLFPVPNYGIFSGLDNK